MNAEAGAEIAKDDAEAAAAAASASKTAAETAKDDAEDPNQFSDTANGVLVGKPTAGYPSDLTIPTQAGMEWALYPTTSSGSDSTYVPDGWSFGGSYPCLRRGGGYNQHLNHGPFYVSYGSASSTNDSIGCRLQERPPKAA